MDTKILALVLVLLGTASVLYTSYDSKSSVSAFAQWKSKYNVNYNSVFEEAYREKVFLENLAKIELHNSQTYQTYKMGINKFTGLTQE